jgi:hypothetical protein
MWTEFFGLLALIDADIFMTLMYDGFEKVVGLCT